MTVHLILGVQEIDLDVLDLKKTKLVPFLFND